MSCGGEVLPARDQTGGKKMKQRMKWLLGLMILLLAMGLCAVALADNFDVKDGIAVKYIGTETEITKEMFENEKVTVVGAGCFKDAKITKVEIPDTVKSIQASAFAGCRQLTSVGLPSGLKTIPDTCFENCTSLQNVSIPAAVTSIGTRAFVNCISLKAVEGTKGVKTKSSDVYKPVPGTVTTVGDNAFSNCPHVVISCFKGSAVEKYAIANSVEYESIDPVVDKITPAAKEYVLIYDKSTTNSLSIVLTIEPAIATATTKNWSTNDPDVAEVSQEGVVTPHKAGVVTITVASDTKWVDQEAANALVKVVVLDSSKGWQQVPDKTGPWYYCNSATEFATGWKEIGGKYYYFDSLGRMQTGWQKIGGAWYYLTDKGVMLTGWQKLDGVWYYLNTDGKRQDGWLLDGTDWYYLDPDNKGAMVTGTKVIGTTTYYFNDNGTLKHAGWTKEKGKWYYLKADLTLAKGWLKDGAVWYYLSTTDGAMQTGWLKDAGKWYYLDPNSGAMRTSWVKINNVWYFFNTDGSMQTGWKKINNTWYYMNSDGAMQTGWLKLNNVWYYCRPSGAMVTGKQTIDGKVYYFDKNGAWIK